MAEWRYAERILSVDLTAGSVTVEPTPAALQRNFVGGAGFVAGLLQPGAVVMAAGPLSDELGGRLALGAHLGDGRTAVSSLGGRMAAALKEAGFDAVVLTGALPSPGALWLWADAFELTPVDPSLEIPELEASLPQSGHVSMLLGPAGETLCHEGHHAGGSGVAEALARMNLRGLLLPEPQALTAGRCDGCTLACAVRRAAGEAAVAAADAKGADLRPAHRHGRPGPHFADLLGTCRRLWRERPGQILQDALSATVRLLA